MGKIFVLMGKSSTGKDTIFKRLLSDSGVSLETIVTYTTRPIRAGEQDGAEYRFTNEEGYQELQKQGKVIEGRAYQTFHGLWRYFTVDDGQIEKDKDYLIIGTLASYTKLVEYFGKERLVPILIELDDGVRLRRALDRECSQECPKYEEMCRRFLADSKDFSEEEIAKAEINKRFVNDNLETCLEEIVTYINKCMQN